ncbi:MAG: hypothetical protein PVS2B2_16800 [Candidatus Acidiferrum sp.]
MANPLLRIVSNGDIDSSIGVFHKEPVGLEFIDLGRWGYPSSFLLHREENQAAKS